MPNNKKAKQKVIPRKNNNQRRKKMRFVETVEEWEALMEESKTKAVFVDFTASWCVRAYMMFGV